MPENITAHLAEFVVGYDVASAQDDVLDAAKALILDGVGVMVAGSRHPIARVLLNYAEKMRGNDVAALLGSVRGTDAGLAAFVHGAMLHVEDYEVQGRVPVHGTSVLLPPALALAEMNGADGREVLGAVITGWEVMARLRVSGPLLDFGGMHPVGIFGPLGAVISSGRILALNAHEMTMALGIVASRSGSLLANNGTMVKSTHPGNAGRMGVESANLARLGLESHPDILGAPRGGFISTMMRGQFDEQKMLDGLSDGRFLVDPGYTIKAYPAEIYMMRVIEAVRTLKAAHRLEPDDVQRLEIVLEHVRPDLSRPKPRSGLDGKFSYEYCAAVALAQEEVTLRSFSDEVRFSPAIEAVLPRIVPVGPPSDHPDPLYGTFVIARAQLRDGSVVEARIDKFKGSMLNPLNRDERVIKFRDCTKGTWTDAQTDRAIEAIESLEQPGSLGTLIGLLRGATT